MNRKILSLAMVIASVAIGFTSCKKTNSSGTTKTEIETTYELSTDQAISDNLTEDANDVFFEAATQNNLTGETPASPLESMGILSCATVTVTPLLGFPKTIVIDFASGCTSQNGITRKGKITVVLSDSVRRPGATAVLTFDGYYVNGYKKDGTITWTNTSTASVKGWQRKVENGQITTPTGNFWYHSGVRNIVQVEGYSTPRNLLDDVFSITGNHSVTNASGVTRTSEIVAPLQKKTICENITKGSIKMQSPNHVAVIDFGDGSCDRVATISIDGGAPRTILLR